MAGDERSFVRRDEDDRIGKLLREAEATHRNSRHQRRLVLWRARKPGQHAGVRRTRRHGVHTDSRLGDLERHRLGDAFDGVLAADIDSGPRRTLMPVGRRDIDDATAALAAERRLRTSQPSLSRQIRDLEYEVGVELLSRGARGVELTVAGKVLLDHARLALMQVDAAVEAARRAAQPASKTFAIGFQTGHEMNWLPRAMHLLPWSVF